MRPSVTGIDVAPAAIAHARARYARPNLTFAEASVTALPLPAASADLVVSFETVEHLREQEAMIDGVPPRPRRPTAFS